MIPEQTSDSRSIGTLKGTVVRGSGRGRPLGFPTANLRLDRTGQQPAAGIYACWAQIEGDAAVYQGALHIGPRPTFSDQESTVELHILQWPDRNLYEKVIFFRPVKKLREVEKFDSIEALQSAITQDVAQVEAVLSSLPKPGTL